MGTDIEAAAIANRLGPFAGRAPGLRSPMPRSGSRERSRGVGSVAAAGLLALLGGKRSSARLEAVARSTAG